MGEKFSFVLSEVFLAKCGGIGKGTTFNAMLEDSGLYRVTWTDGDEEYRHLGVEGVMYDLETIEDAFNVGHWELV